MALADRTPPTAEDYAAYPERFSNWGRWGPGDELGTLNHITPGVRRAAAALVTEGRSISLSRPIDTNPGAHNPHPAHHMVSTRQNRGMADHLSMFIHGFSQTHIDALAHIAADHGDFYDGVGRDSYGMPAEHRGTIDYWRDGIVTRGVLYDIPRLRGEPYVTPGRPVQAWELVDAAASQGVEPRAGDAVIIRSGYGPYFEATGESPGFGSPAGVHASCVEFLYETDAALLVWDMQDAPLADQGLPNPLPIPVPLHVHRVLIPYLGMPILDNADLEVIAVACAELSRWEFELVVAPLVIPGGTGSPVNPIAVL